MNDRPTPETEAFEEANESALKNGFNDWPDFARTLERQRDELLELLVKADEYVHCCPLKARIRIAIAAVKGKRK